MKILFLDDDKIRHKYAEDWFKSRIKFENNNGNVQIPEFKIYRAFNASEAIGLYLLNQNSQFPFNIISLDHDLCDNYDGRHVSDNILLLHDKLEMPKPKIEIHSWNIPAAQQMWWKFKSNNFDVTQEVFSPLKYMEEL